MTVPTPSPPVVQNHQESDDDIDGTLQKLFDSASPSEDEYENGGEVSLPKSMQPSNSNQSGVAKKIRLGRTNQPPTSRISALSESHGRNDQAATRKRKSTSAPPKRSQNSFRIVGNVIPKQTGTRYSISEKNVSNMILRGSPLDPAHLSALFELSERIDISQISSRFDDIRAGRVGEWVIFGCLVKKHAKRETKNGAKFAVWSLYNMPRWGIGDSQHPPEATMITVLVFDQAFTNLHNLVEGSALAMRRAVLLPPRDSETGARSERGGTEWCGYCIKVTKTEQVVVLGMCQDYRLCGEPNGDAGECQVWFDANRLKMCSRHTQQKRMRMLRGTRMDVNNAERPMGRAEGGTSAIGQVTDVSRASFGEVPLQRASAMLDGHKRRNAADRDKAMALIKRQEAVRGVAKNVRAPSLSQLLHQRTKKQNAAQLALQTDERLKCVMKRGRIMIQQTEPQQHRGSIKEQRQHDYNCAVDNLVRLGFKINNRGDLIAPERVPGVTLRKNSVSRATEKGLNGLRKMNEAIDEKDLKPKSQVDSTCATDDVYLSDESAS